MVSNPVLTSQTDLTGTDYFKDRVDPWKNWVFTFAARPKPEVVGDRCVLIFDRAPPSL